MSSVVDEVSRPQKPGFGFFARPATRSLIGGLAAAAAWFVVAALTAFWPDKLESDWAYTGDFAAACGAFAVALALAAFAGVRFTVFQRLQRLSPWLLALALFLAAWEVVTAKLGLLPLPFFPPPQAIVEVVIDDWGRLAAGIFASARLLATGYFLGAAVGFVTGVAIGWSRLAGYWIHPVLRFIGPLPATAWLPLAFFVFPSSFSASIFLIALATGFPVTVLTWSGVAGVNSAYYDIARTLGATQRFLVLKVAIPAAMPHVFVGLFMGLGNSFAVLVVAEMLGVKAGLGWYLQWAQGWAAYANMYAALLLMAFLCSGLITLLFRLRDRLLSWQKRSGAVVAATARRLPGPRIDADDPRSEPSLRSGRAAAAGIGPHQPAGRPRRVRRSPGAEWVRKIDLAAAGRGARHSDRRLSANGGKGDRSTRSVARRRFSRPHALSMADGLEQRCARSGSTRVAAHASRTYRRRVAPGRAHRLRQCLPAPAFGRHGATRGSGARAGQRPEAAHSRRAFGPARTR